MTRIDVPGAVIGTAAFDVNDLDTVVGMYGNPNASPSARRGGGPMDPMRSLLRMAGSR